ncbi:hypothetical protein LTR73_008621 [Friedmanniomyces endolithicus]|nr:hypothetical protein LTR73_008621 [Friedmanniomyces endolithicus]
MSRFRILEMDTLMERNESGAGRNVSTILDEIESLCFRLRELTAHLYAMPGKSAVEDGNTEQNFDPLLQRFEHFAQQRAETQEKLQRTAPQNSSAKTDMAVTGRSVEEHWAVCLQEFIADWGMMKDTDARSPRTPRCMTQSRSQRGHHTATAMVTKHTARGTFMRMLRTHSGNLSYIPNQSRGLNLPEYDGGVGAQNEARIMKPEGSNGEHSVLWKGPKPVNQELVMRRRLVTMTRHPEQIDHRVGHSPDDQEWIDNSKPSSDQHQTSRQASLALDNMAAQYALARRSWRSSYESAAGSLLPPLGELSGANGPVQSSVYENHTDDDTAREPPSASTRPELCSPVSTAAPAEPHPPPLSSCSLP